MDKSPAPLSDDVIESLRPIMSDAIHAFQQDVSYGVAIIAAGRKVAARRNKAANSVVEAVSA